MLIMIRAGPDNGMGRWHLIHGAMHAQCLASTGLTCVCTLGAAPQVCLQAVHLVA